MCTHIHISTYVCMHIYKHKCVHTYRQVYAYTQALMCVHICTQVHTHMHKGKHARAHKYMHVHTHTHEHTHMCIGPHKHTQIQIMLRYREEISNPRFVSNEETELLTQETHGLEEDSFCALWKSKWVGTHLPLACAPWVFPFLPVISLPPLPGKCSCHISERCSECLLGSSSLSIRESKVHTDW